MPLTCNPPLLKLEKLYKVEPLRVIDEDETTTVSAPLVPSTKI